MLLTHGRKSSFVVVVVVDVVAVGVVVCFGFSRKTLTCSFFDVVDIVDNVVVVVVIVIVVVVDPRNLLLKLG